VTGRERDRLGQIVRFGLAAIDEREHVEARGLLLRGHPHAAIAAAERGDRRGAWELESTLGHARVRIPFLDGVRVGDEEVRSRDARVGGHGARGIWDADE
jgi:hypothetical protein